MAAFNGLAQLQIQSTLSDGQAVNNTVHLANTGLGAPPDVTKLTDLATQWWTYFSATYLALSPTTMTVQQILTKQVIDPASGGIPLEAAHPVGTAGTRGTGARQGPNSLCGVIAFKTPNASRRFRGHNFAPPIVDVASLSGNQLDPAGAYKTALDAYIVKLQTGCLPAVTWTGAELSSWHLCIYSHAAAVLSEPSVAATALVVRRDKVSFLRSRERGGS